MAHRHHGPRTQVLFADQPRARAGRTKSRAMEILYQSRELRAGGTMSAAPALIQRIVADAGIVSTRRRRDLERELAAHLEDLRSDGEDPATHFGDPREIAEAFTRVYRPERMAFHAGGIFLLAAVSWTVSAAIVGAVQFLLAKALGFSPAKLFSPEHLVWETIQMAALTLGSLGIHYTQKLFSRWRLAK